MDKDRIIRYICEEPEFKKVVYRICPVYEFKEDTFHDLILQVNRMSEEKLIDLYNRSSLLHYCIRIIQYEKFWLKYQSFHDQIEELEVKQEDKDDSLYEIADFELSKERFENKGDWYITKIAGNYIEAGSLRKLSEKIEVPYRSLGLAVNQFRDKIVIKHKQYEVFMAKNVLNDLPDDAKKKLYLASVKKGKTPEKLMEELINGLDKGKPKAR